MEANCRVPPGSAEQFDAKLSHDTDLGAPTCQVGESSEARRSRRLALGANDCMFRNVFAGANAQSTVCRESSALPQTESKLLSSVFTVLTSRFNLSPIL